jgi:HEAT repeat protein
MSVGRRSTVTPLAVGTRVAGRVVMRHLIIAAVLLSPLGPVQSAGGDQSTRASASVLSEHHLEALKSMAPQQQAELLLERAINRYRGATDEIIARAPGWLGRITSTPRLESLFRMAINSDDMRVRVAAIELNVSARGLARGSETMDRLEADARGGAQGPRANALWDIALLGNRGVLPERALEIIRSGVHDENVNIRYWAVESLAFLGTDAVIEPLLQIFHDDPSPMIRERAACGLAQSGMLNEEQRWRAVPRLLDYTADYSLDAATRSWVFQALRDITGQSLPPDPSAWRNWYARNR